MNISPTIVNQIPDIDQKLLNYDSYNIRPQPGRLVSLQTKTEAQARLKLVDAYAIEIPLKSANIIVKTIDATVPQRHEINLQHLRRLTKPEFLPPHLRTSPNQQGLLGREYYTHGSYDEIIDDGQEQKSCEKPETAAIAFQHVLHLLLCARSLISQENLLATLSSIPAFSTAETQSFLHIVPVPLLSPTSQEQAAQWSKSYWPTVYRKNNPFGPHHSIVSRSEAIIRPFAGAWMTLARLAGSEAFDNNIGAAIGVAVMDPLSSNPPSAVAVAGDARWARSSCAGGKWNPDVMAHAVMRAIGMVGRKRREVAEEQHATFATELDADTFVDLPLTQVEHEVYSRNSIRAGGYLCVGLDIYVTHEPCVMCSMAILHSRFNRVIFGKRMPFTGGLTSETGEGSGNGLGYGLFWIHELNWKMLAWQWIDQEDMQMTGPKDDVHA